MTCFTKVRAQFVECTVQKLLAREFLRTRCKASNFKNICAPTIIYIAVTRLISANRIHISGETNYYLTRVFGGYVTQSRGEILVKGKGKYKYLEKVDEHQMVQSIK
jgi:hypothetical protein